MRSITTRALLSQIRSQIDENNEANLSDEIDLLPALNRGMDDALDILSRKYPSAVIQPLDVTPVNGQSTYDMPADSFQERLEKVEVEVNGYFEEIKRLDYQDITPFDVPGTAASPYYYVVIGNQFRLVPTPSGVQNIRIWYVPEQGPLVPEYGRVTSINSDQNYVQLTDVEDTEQVTSDISSLESYVNVVNGRTGTIKATLQVGSVVNGRMQFRSTPTRTTVQGRNVSGSLPSTVEQDDYICPVFGTCIPVMRGSLVNFLIAYVTADIKALKLDGDPQLPVKLLEKFEERVERLWVRRESDLRVTKSSRVWGPSRRSLYSRVNR